MSDLDRAILMTDTEKRLAEIERAGWPKVHPGGSIIEELLATVRGKDDEIARLRSTLAATQEVSDGWKRACLEVRAERDEAREDSLDHAGEAERNMALAREVTGLLDDALVRRPNWEEETKALLAAHPELHP